MINILPLTIEGLVAILLLLTILYCVRLNTQLKRLKADEATMAATIAELVTATETAERAIAGLKITVREADEKLGEQLRAAETFTGEIRRDIAAGAAVLERLTQIADARPWLMGVDPPVEEKPGPLDAKSIAAAAQAFTDRARARVRDLAA